MKRELQSSWQGPRNVINVEGQIFSCPSVLPLHAPGRCREGRVGRKRTGVAGSRERRLWVMKQKKLGVQVSSVPISGPTHVPIRAQGTGTVSSTSSSTTSSADEELMALRD